MVLNVHKRLELCSITKLLNSLVYQTCINVRTFDNTTKLFTTNRKQFEMYL